MVSKDQGDSNMTNKQLNRKVLIKIAINFIKKYISIYSLKSLVSLLSSLRKKRVDLWKILLDTSNARFALSISGMSAFYPLLLRILSTTSLNEKYQAGVAGAISSLWLTIDPVRSRTTTISQMVFMRTLYYAIRAFIYEKDIKEHHQISDVDRLDGIKKPIDSKKVEHSNHVIVRSSNSPKLQFLRHLAHSNRILIIHLVCHFSFGYPRYMTKSFYKTLVDLTASHGRHAYNNFRGLSDAIAFFASCKTIHPMEFNKTDMNSLDYYQHWENKLPVGDKLKSLLQQVSTVKSSYTPGVKHYSLLCSMQHPRESKYQLQ
ncbi:hypothetical protein HDV02_005948 [Globomyces sp. JEL0801]|nr:hypothetical protein HDV02_005948 [Globomyces sp. JEL0801]